MWACFLVINGCVKWLPIHAGCLFPYGQQQVISEPFCFFTDPTAWEHQVSMSRGYKHFFKPDIMMPSESYSHSSLLLQNVKTFMCYVVNVVQCMVMYLLEKWHIHLIPCVLWYAVVDNWMLSICCITPVTLSGFFCCRRYLRETLKMANAEDLNRLTSCSLVLLGHIFLSLGNSQVRLC